MQFPSVVFGIACVVVTLLVVTLFGEDKPVDIKTLRPFAEKTNQFGFDLYQRFRSSTGNIFFSPYSISTALAMTAAGARGDTFNQMTKVLGIENDIARFSSQHEALMDSLMFLSAGTDIYIANALWAHEKYTFRDDYFKLLLRAYRAEANSLDFQKSEASRNTINRWVETKTNGCIKNLIQKGIITPDTRLVLTNATYFKGTWASKFKKDANKLIEFTLSSSEKIVTEAMYQQSKYKYFESEDLQAIELPYHGSRVSMVVLLPRQMKGLAKIEEKWTPEVLNELSTSKVFQEVQLTLPKFKTTYLANLNKELQGMGMIDAFSASKANFSGMDGTRSLILSDVLHQAFCDVNEEGTEAAAATAGHIIKIKDTTPLKPKVFKADHPFLFLIRDTQTGSVLFMGRMMDPKN